MDIINTYIKQILIVDEDQIFSKNLSDVLNEYHISTYVVFSGSEAIDMIEKYRFDMIIIDQGIKDYHANSLIEMIKTYHPTTLVLSTSTSIKRSTVRALNFGADFIIDKPFTFNDFAELINRFPI